MGTIVYSEITLWATSSDQDSNASSLPVADLTATVISFSIKEIKRLPFLHNNNHTSVGYILNMRIALFYMHKH